MDDCRCGCGEEASNGDFIAGHSQKLTSSLVKEVGGLFALQDLIQAAKQYSYGEKNHKGVLGSYPANLSGKESEIGCRPGQSLGNAIYLHRIFTS